MYEDTGQPPHGPIHNNEQRIPYVNRYGMTDCGPYFVFVEKKSFTEIETEVLNPDGSIAERINRINKGRFGEHV